MVFADESLSKLCVSFIGKFVNPEEAMAALRQELSAVRVLLFVGTMREAMDDVTCIVREPFRLVRFSSTLR